MILPIRELLESYPLYRKYRVELPHELFKLSKPAVNLDCQICKSAQTFNMINEYYEGAPAANISPLGWASRVEYVCASCKRFRWFFSLKFDEDEKGTYVCKAGQVPEPEIQPSKVMGRELGPSIELYKKGLVCESQSYGIGAFAYYRRVLEEVILLLLDDVAELVPQEGEQKYLDGLTKVKSQKTAEDRIYIAKDLLPQSLRITANPLEVLYSSLSEGLHSGSEERCMELAATIRKVFESLVIQIQAQKNSAKALSEGTKRLLSEKGHIHNDV